MIAPDSPVTAAALDAWLDRAHLPNAPRMAAALEAAVAEFRRRNVFAAIALPADAQREDVG